MKFLHQAIVDGHCIIDLNVHSLEEASEAALKFLIQKGRLSVEDLKPALEAIQENEKMYPSAIGHASAIPHYYSDNLSEPSIVYVKLHHGINQGAPDGIAVRFVFLLVGPTSAARSHLETIATVARLMSDDEVHYEMRKAKTETQIVEAFEHFMDRNRPRKVADFTEPSEGMITGPKPFAGILKDLKRRIPHYVSDLKDGMQPKCVASILFLFFACLAPAITFGGLMADQTGAQIGAVEMLVGTAICGVIYSLFAGQPLIILGGIGPLFVFTVILYRLCGDMDVQEHFLSVYGWVGLWTALFTSLLAIFNASNLMRFFTRFTDEIFSALMSLIFIYEAVKALYLRFAASADAGGGFDGAFLALVLAMGTFYIGMTLSRFRKSHYLTSWMREFLADFGPSIALGLMAIVYAFAKDWVTVEPLKVGSGFGTTSGRDWLVNIFAAPQWTWWAAAGPAVLATVLIFLSQNITARLVNSPDNKLRKGESYHWDLLIVGLLVALCSFFGFPWLVAATVRSLAHVRALADSEEVATPDGKHKDHITHTIETRVSGLVIHILIGLSLLALPLLVYIPKPALYGIFLFMGFASFGGNQLMERLGLWLTDKDLYPSHHYIRHVPNRTIHVYTLLQFICLVVLCGLNVAKSEVIRILFPFFIAVLVPVRFMMGKYFEDEHLAYLDADEMPDEEEAHWV